jgi:hypothetical protein
MSIQHLTPLDLWQIRMEAIVPIIRDLQGAFGKEAVLEVLRKRNEAQLQEAVTAAPDQPDYAGLDGFWGHFGKNGLLDFEKRNNDSAVEIDIVECKYARMAQEMGAADIGSILICGRDYMHAARLGFKLTRTQTRMLGARTCDFVFAEPKDQEQTDQDADS